DDLSSRDPHHKSLLEPRRRVFPKRDACFSRCFPSATVRTGVRYKVCAYAFVHGRSYALITREDSKRSNALMKINLVFRLFITVLRYPAPTFCEHWGHWSEADKLKKTEAKWLLARKPAVTADRPLQVWLRPIRISRPRASDTAASDIQLLIPEYTEHMLLSLLELDSSLCQYSGSRYKVTV